MEIRRYFSGRFFLAHIGTVQEGELGRFHRYLEADMRFGLEAAAVAFRLGVPEELRAWADAGPDLELPGPARAWYHRWIVLQKGRKPGLPPGANEAPPPEMCARQLDEWFPIDHRESVFLPEGLTFAITEARRLQNFAPVRVLLAFGCMHDESRRQIWDGRPADDSRKLSRAEEAVAEIAEIGHREPSEPLDVVLFRIALTARKFPAKVRGEVFAWADGVSIDDEASELKRIAQTSRGAALERLFLEGDTALDDEVIAAICGRETTARAQRLRGRLRDDRFKACVPRLLARSRDDGERQELRRMLGLPEPEQKGAPTARVAVDLSEHEGALREERLLIACREALADTPGGRAFLARLADEARASGNLVEALYFELQAGRPVVDLVRRILEQPELEALDDDFQLVWRSRKPIGVAGGFVTLIRLALTDATDEQLRRLARELSTTETRTRRFDSHWVRAADREERLPDPRPQLGGGGVFCRRDAVCALVGRLTVDERLALGRARLFELDQIDFWKRHAPLSELWSLLEEVRRSPDTDDTGRSRLYEEGEPCLNALADRDPERFQATAQEWLAEPDIDSRLARELMRRLLRDRPELCVPLFEALLVHPAAENRDWARRWAADAAPTLPRGGALMRRITYGE
jgi:hypothetical protein